MRVLVTGGAGFLGSHICDRLIAEGHTVICLDSLLTGREKNIAHLLDHYRFIFFRYDITQPFYIAEKVDWVLHFASPASPKDYAANPIHTLKVGGLGTYHMLGLAKAHKAKFLLASTSEVYGDPEVHPQPESYWGNVNPIGPRSCYDEAKRFAEALTMAYWRQHGVDVRIVRIFNSILSNERVVVFNDEQIHLEPIGEYFARTVKEGTVNSRKIFVPAFDPQTGEISLRTVSALIRHPCTTDAYCLHLSYGRKLRVTGDHSVFTRSKDNKPIAVPVRQLRVGDYVAIPAKLPVIERDITEICLSDELIHRLPKSELWRYRIVSPQIPLLIDRHRRMLRQLLQKSGRTRVKKFWGANNILTACKRTRSLPLFIFAKLGLPIPEDALIRPQSSRQTLPNRIRVTDELLWLCGLFLAEGYVHADESKNYCFISLSSDHHFLERAAKILKQTFGIQARWERRATKHSAPTIRVGNKLLVFLFDKVLGLGGKATEKHIPQWVFQLPLSRLKWFLEGYKDGDGTHSGKSVGRGLCFNTSSQQLADDLALLLLRFGLVASLGEYTTTFKRRYGNRKFTFYRLTLRGLSTFDILTWDKGVTQKLLHRRWGDLVWAQVKAIEPTVLTPEVYDFSVPEYENFIAGNGVCAHNTVGPRMRLDDGRVFPNFICQALKGEPITVYGDGSQTRSFCYVDDLIDGVMKVMEWTPPDDADELARVFNLGNPEEITVLEFAHLVKEVTGSNSPIVFCPLPKDDPKQRRPDITKAKTVLGWSPKVSLREAIERTLPYFKEELFQSHNGAIAVRSHSGQQQV